MSAPDKNSPEHLLTIKEVASFCHVSVKTVRRWIDANELPAAKLGAQWRIRPKDLDMFIKEQLQW